MENLSALATETTRYFNRDLSWLSFNLRVLEESLDPQLPLIEKIKFIAIHASNLDEFYRVRVAHLETLSKLGDFNDEENRSYHDILAEVRKEASHQTNYLRSILAATVIPGLAENNIILYQDHKEVRDEHLEFVYEYFNTQVASYLQPIWLTNETTPFLEDRQLYLIWDVLHNDSHEQLILLNLPTQHLPRFIALPKIDDKNYVIYLDDIVRIGGEKLLENYTVKGCFSIKLNRDAELYLDEHAGAIAREMRDRLVQRALGAPSRFQYDAAMPRDLVSVCVNLFNIESDELTATGRYQQMSDFFSFPIPAGALPSLAKWKPLKHQELTSYKNYFRALDEKDFLLFFPYQSYDHVLIFFNQAVLDPYVTEIMATFYRVASDSHIVNALISASKNGKKVRAFVEVKARFDEANNLLWAEKMEKAGIEISYSLPDIKVHAKTALIKRVKDGVTKTYGFYGTGNFNERTAGIYSDIGLLTSNPAMNEELKDVFLYLYTGKKPAPFNHLLVSQFNIIERFKELINDEIKIARNGGNGKIIIKLNNLEDSEMIDALYEASNAGVKVEMIVRSICRLRPGIPGLSENISVTRVVGRYLEHSRIFIFNNHNEPKIFLGSSDWMERNLRSRVEVVFPVHDEACKAEIFDFINLQLAPSRKTSVLDKDLRSVPPTPGNEGINDSQEAFYQLIMKSN
jgi:polyphosphate kinase